MNWIFVFSVDNKSKERNFSLLVPETLSNEGMEALSLGESEKNVEQVKHKMNIYFFLLKHLYCDTPMLASILIQLNYIYIYYMIYTNCAIFNYI